MPKTPKFKVWWDEKEGIIRSKAWGDFEEDDAREQTALILSLFETRPGKVLVLNDLTEAGKASSRARRNFADLMKEDKIEKQAFVGMKTMTRVIVSFIMNFSGVKNARYFDTEKEALKWLKEGKQDGQIGA